MCRCLQYLHHTVKIRSHQYFWKYYTFKTIHKISSYTLFLCDIRHGKTETDKYCNFLADIVSSQYISLIDLKLNGTFEVFSSLPAINWDSLHASTEEIINYAKIGRIIYRDETKGLTWFRASGPERWKLCGLVLTQCLKNYVTLAVT